MADISDKTEETKTKYPMKLPIYIIATEFSRIDKDVPVKQICFEVGDKFLPIESFMDDVHLYYIDRSNAYEKKPITSVAEIQHPAIRFLAEQLPGPHFEVNQKPLIWLREKIDELVNLKQFPIIVIIDQDEYESLCFMSPNLWTIFGFAIDDIHFHYVHAEPSMCCSAIFNLPNIFGGKARLNIKKD